MERLVNLDEIRVSHAVVNSPIWNTQTVVEPDAVQVTKPQSDGDWLVTVYNNETNTYVEVVAILMLATGCDAEEAYIETWEIDHYGQCTVHRASQEICEKTAKVIATIGIRVEAQPDPYL